MVNRPRGYPRVLTMSVKGGGGVEEEVIFFRVSVENYAQYFNLLFSKHRESSLSDS